MRFGQYGVKGQASVAERITYTVEFLTQLRNEELSLRMRARIVKGPVAGVQPEALGSKASRGQAFPLQENVTRVFIWIPSIPVCMNYMERIDRNLRCFPCSWKLCVLCLIQTMSDAKGLAVAFLLYGYRK